MPAEVKDLINAWLSVLVDFLRFFDDENVNKIADAIEAKLPKEEA